MSPSTTRCQEKIDIQVYWYGNVTLFLDKVVVEDDSIGKKLFAGSLDGSVTTAANNFSSASKLTRFYLYDEPPVSSFLGYHYVDNILQTIGAVAGMTPTYFTESKLNRFVNDAQPQEIVVDNYVISPWIPVPTYLLSAGEASSLGIAAYTTDSGFVNAYDK